MKKKPTLETQCEQIRDYLLTGCKITPLDAMRLFKCFRLGARVFELKQQGYNIESKMVYNKDMGTRYAEYSLKTNKV